MLRIVRQYVVFMNCCLLMPMIALLPFQDPAPHPVIITLMWSCFAIQVVLLILSYVKNLKAVYVMAYMWHLRLFVGLVGKPEQHRECVPRDVFEQDSLDTHSQIALILVNLLVLMYLNDKHGGKLFITTFICLILGLVQELTGFQNIAEVGLRLYSYSPMSVIAA